VRCLGTGKVTASSVWAPRRSGRWWSGPHGSRCCCVCPACTATASRPGSTTVRRWPGTGPGAVRDAIAYSIVTLPEQLRRSLTWDQGAELAQHAQLRIDIGLQVFFCDPHSPGSAAPTRTPTGCCASPPQGHRPEQPQRRRPRCRRRRTQRPTPQDPGLENTRQDPRRATVEPANSRRCCNDPLNLRSTPPAPACRPAGGWGCAARWAHGLVPGQRRR
jgi:hypothetical protein